jgi:hypothetical protein
VRNPSDSPLAIIRRRSAAGKAIFLNAVAVGFGARVRQAGFPINHGFSGVSLFDPSDSYAQELASFFSHPGRRHLVMCHPGYPDSELENLDAVRERRRDELAAILAAPGLPEMIWHAGARDESGFPLWPGMGIR